MPVSKDVVERFHKQISEGKMTWDWIIAHAVAVLGEDDLPTDVRKTHVELLLQVAAEMREMEVARSVQWKNIREASK